MTYPTRLRSRAASVYIAEVHGVAVSEQTLNKYRCIGGGPAFRKFGRIVVYDRDDLDAWALARLGSPRRNTSAEG